MSVQAVAVVQRAIRQADPAEVMADMGFGEVELVSSFAVSMSGAHLLVRLLVETLKENRLAHESLCNHQVPAHAFDLLMIGPTIHSKTSGLLALRYKLLRLMPYPHGRRLQYLQVHELFK